MQRVVKRLVVAAAFVCISMAAMAATEIVDGIEWTYTIAGGYASVGGGSSSSTAVPKSTSGAIAIPSTLGGCPVTAIRPSAFENCTALTSVTIPSGVKSINGSAFRGCTCLTDVTIPEGVTAIAAMAFEGCSSLAHVTIPSSIAIFGGNSVFRGCTSLMDVAIPQYVGTNQFSYVFPTTYQSITNVVFLDDVKVIGGSALRGCTGLTSLTLPEGVETIGDYAFQGCTSLAEVTIPSSVTNIKKYAFANCSVLTSVVFNGNAPTVDNSAFLYVNSNCTAYVERGSTGWGVDIPGAWWEARIQIAYIPQPTFTIANGELTAVELNGAKDVTIPDEVTYIGVHAFLWCSGLKSVAIPDSVTKIEWEAFFGCSNLVNVTIGTGLTSIGDAAFGCCGSLRSISVDAENRVYSSCNGMVLSKDGKTLVQGVNGRVVIPDGVTDIGKDAFFGCSGLASVIMPNSVTNIGKSAFSGCRALTSVAIPDGVTNIGESAFSGCRALTSVTIPDSVTSIGSYAFSGCSGLRSVTVPQLVCSGEMSSLFPDAYQSITNVVVLDGATNIGRRAFCGCSGLVRVTIPNSVVNIGVGAFERCALESVCVPSSVIAIGSRAFSDCEGLTNIVVLAGDIGERAFWGCGDDSPTTLTLAEGVTSIGAYAFSGCYGIKELAVPTSVTNVMGEAFEYSITNLVVNSRRAFAALMPQRKEYIERDVTIGDECRSVDDYFGSYYGIRNLKLGNNVETIGDEAFTHGEMTDVEIPDSVTDVGRLFLSGCHNLSTVVFGSGVTNIGDSAMYDCENLTSVVFKGAVAPTFGAPDECESFFNGRSVSQELCIYVAKGSTGWGVEIPGSWHGVRIEYIPEPVFTIEDGVLADVELNGATEVIIPNGVTRIGSWVFSDCTNLTKVVIPRGVTEIGWNAFSGCSRLSHIAIPDSVTSIEACAFQGCRELADANGFVIVRDVLYDYFGSSASLAIPSNVKIIGEGVFYGCTNMTSVTIPNSVTEIGSEAFSCCSGLARIDIPYSVARIERYAFIGCRGLTSATIPNSETYIGSLAFSGCGGLRSVTIPQCVCYDGIGQTFAEAHESITNIVVADGVTCIGAGAFRNCSGLTNVSIPGSVTVIGDRAFSGCGALGGVAIPDSVYVIGAEAFSGCSEGVFDTTTLQGVKLVDGWAVGYESILSATLDLSSVRGIAEEAFRNCSGIKKVTVPQCVVSYYGVENVFPSSCQSIADIAIADGVTEVGYLVLSSCSSLTRLTIPNSVTNVGVFYGCSGLRNVTVPQCICSSRMSYVFPDAYQVIETVRISEGVKNVGASAFNGCSSLTSVTIPSSVRNLAAPAFYNCSALESVLFKGNSPAGSGLLVNSTASCIAYVLPSSTGWGVSEGGKWRGLTLKHWYEGFPEVTSDSAVPDAMVGVVDESLSDVITNVAAYNAFRTWALGVKDVDGALAGDVAAKASPHAAAAYVLGAERLFENEPTIEFGELSVGDRVSGMTTMTVDVTVKDGNQSVAVDAAKVAAMFEATGDLGDWNGASRLTPTVTTSGTDSSGKMTFVVTPGDGTADKAFLRIKR